MRVGIAGTVIALVSTAIAWIAAGASLGLFLAGVFAVMVLVPLMDEAQSGAKPRAAEEAVSVRSRLSVALAVVHAVALVWLIAAVCSSLTFSQCLQAYLVLISIASAAFGLRLLRISARLVVIAGIAWFASPVLLANVMTGGSPVTSFITRYHPLFALNRVMIDQGAWSSSEFAYQYLTPLGQDAPYILPESVWPCVIAHALVTAGCALIFAVLVKRGQKAIVLC